MGFSDFIRGFVKGIEQGRGDTFGGIATQAMASTQNTVCKDIAKKINLTHKNCDVFKLMEEIDTVLNHEISDCMDKYIKSNYPNCNCTFNSLLLTNNGLDQKEKNKIMFELNNIVNDKLIDKIDAYTMNKYGVSVRRELEQAYPRRS